MKGDPMLYDTYDQDTCPQCGSNRPPKIVKTNENTDADGNRGIEVITVTCLDCDYEEVN